MDPLKFILLLFAGVIQQQENAAVHQVGHLKVVAQINALLVLTAKIACLSVAVNEMDSATILTDLACVNQATLVAGIVTCVFMLSGEF